MKKTLRQTSPLQTVGIVLRLCLCSALAGAIATPLLAADAVHAHAKHVTAQSAGVQAAHGPIQQTALTRRQEREVIATKSQGRAVSKSVSRKNAAKSSSVSSRAQKMSVQSHEQGAAKLPTRRRGRALQMPPPHQAVTSKRETASGKSTGSKGIAPTTDASAEKKAATVEDFLRAAKQGAAKESTAQPNSEVVAEGVAKPDDSEKIETRDAPVAVKFAASVTSVKKPVLVVTADAPRPAPRQRVVQGFGAEVDVVPNAAVNTARAKKSVPQIDDWKTEDIATKRAMSDEAAMPVLVPLYSRSGKLITPAPLKGSREILVHQNTMADQEGLSRIQDDADLERMLDAHLLLKIPETSALYVNEELPVNRRYARPWTVKFVGDLSRAYSEKFHDALRLSSAVRTVDFQLRLQRVNGNAAAVDGDTASPHLTGQAVDFGKKGMSRAEIAWMRAYLMPLIQSGKIDVEEEFQQSCFHISVYANYVPKKKVARMDVAEGQ